MKTPTIQTIPRDILQVVRHGKVIREDIKPLYVWRKGMPWMGTRVHLLDAHGRSDCGLVDLRSEGRLKRFKVSRSMPDFMMCQKCNWYGQHRPFGS